ncbi:MAG: ricin-type beta-trefoil lectin domain protein [Myxococcales bacterium]|nr:ricin-type beta-trefoil lectin domain protein [Myxococcales bacterium]
MGGPGKVVVVNKQNKIYRWDPYQNTWEELRGATATKASIGADGSIWILTTQRVGGGYSVKRYFHGEWQDAPGGAVSIDTFNKGMLFVANDGRTIFRGKLTSRYANAGGQRQSFTLKTEHHGANKCLEENGGNLSIGDCRYGAANQQWLYDPMQKTIMNASRSNLCLEMDIHRNRLVQRGCQGQQLGNQQWVIDVSRQALRSEFYLYTRKKRKDKGMCLDAAKGGQFVQMYKCHHKGNQRWFFVPTAADKPGEPTDKKVCLRSQSGRFLSVETSTSIAADRTQCGPWEAMSMKDINGNDLRVGDKVSFRSHLGLYVGAQPDGSLLAVAPRLGPWETFTIEQPGKRTGSSIDWGQQVCLFGASHRRYIRAEGGGGNKRKTRADRKKCGNHERFYLTPQP